MPAVRQLSQSDATGVASLWQSATDHRRRELGLPSFDEPGNVLARPGVFAVGVEDGADLLAIAVAMPGRGDNGRSEHNILGLAHISSVATLPGHWGQGLATRCVRAILGQANRRGYARVQLWTQASNTRARALYEREGFDLTGRTFTHENGEVLVHFHRTLPEVPWSARQAARLVCLDPDDRILLLHWRDPLDGFQLWEPPGGGVEDGETLYDAVVREWAEETGLPLPAMSGDSTEVGRDVIFNGVRGIVDETFFLGRASEPGIPQADEATAVEQDAYIGHEWLHWRDLAALEDPVEPDLLPVLKRLAPEGPWAT